MNHLDLDNLFRQTRLIVCEAWTGTDIVGWYGGIERQIEAMVRTYDLAHNFEYVTMLEQFLKTWRAHELTGSINMDDVNVLLAAASQLSTVDWSQQNYFSNLRDSLRRIKAGEEQLPRGTASIDRVKPKTRQSLSKEISSPYSPPTGTEPVEGETAPAPAPAAVPFGNL